VAGVELAVPVVSARAFTADEDGRCSPSTASTSRTTHGPRVRRATGRARADDRRVPSQPVHLRGRSPRAGIAVGDALALVTPSGPRRFTVRGLLEPEGVARVYGGNLVVMDLLAAEAIFTRPGFVSAVDVVVRRDADVGATRDAIARILPAGLRVDTPAQRKADLHRLMRSLQLFLTALGLVGLVAAFLIAFNRLGVIFESAPGRSAFPRRRSPAARGAPRAREGGAATGVLGVALGLPVALASGGSFSPSSRPTALNCSWRPRGPSSRAGCSRRRRPRAGAAALAAFLPASRAARVAVAHVLRQRDVETEPSSARDAWLLRAIVAAGAAGALLLQTATDAVVWGLVATGLLAVGAALAARPLFAVVRRPLAALGTLLDPASRFAIESVLARPRRTTLTVAMIGVGLGAVVWFQTIARSFEETVVDTLGPALHADLAVHSAHLATGFLEEPVDGALVDALAALPGVHSVAGQRIADWPVGDGLVALNAYDPAFFRDPAFGRFPLFGARAADVWTPSRAATACSSPAASRSTSGSGSAIRSAESPGGPIRLRVAGVTNDFTPARGVIEMSRDVYRHGWNDGRAHASAVRAAPGGDVEALRATIARSLGRTYDLHVLSSGELMEHFATQVRRAFAAVAVARPRPAPRPGRHGRQPHAGVLERTRELGAIRALGVRPRRVARTILVEAVVIAGSAPSSPPPSASCSASSG
jgi:putative ABC transport system permease protein